MTHPLLLVSQAELDRFFAKVEPEPMSGCWLWVGSQSSKGYGSLNLRQKMQRAHRVSLYSLGGGFNPDLTVDHLCNNPSCVNPDHLAPATVLENIQRGGNRAKTHCPRGHEYSDENTAVRKDGSRACRACSRASSRAHYWRKKRGLL